MEINKIYNYNCLEGLKLLADSSVDCCVTSPPFWGLRDYGTATWIGGDENCSHTIGRFEYSVSGKQKSNSGSAGHQSRDICPKCGAIRQDEQLGLEKTPEEYVANMVKVFSDVKRALKPRGTLWLNLGDSYASGGRGYNEEHAKFLGNGQAEAQSLGYKKPPPGLKHKDMVGIPWMTAFALRSDGWYLRQDIIWHKPNPMPESVTDRCTKSHEYIFLLSKSQKYYFDNIAIQEPAVHREDPRAGYGRLHYRGKREGVDGTGHENFVKIVDNRNKRDVWTVNTKPYKEAHFAVYPEELIVDCIKAGCPPGGVVLDPFMGSGTTAVVARKLDRNFIGFELNPEYITIADKRLYEELGMFL